VQHRTKFLVVAAHSWCKCIFQDLSGNFKNAHICIYQIWVIIPGIWLRITFRKSANPNFSLVFSASLRMSFF